MEAGPHRSEKGGGALAEEEGRERRQRVSRERSHSRPPPLVRPGRGAAEWAPRCKSAPQTPRREDHPGRLFAARSRHVARCRREASGRTPVRIEEEQKPEGRSGLTAGQGGTHEEHEVETHTG